MPYFSGVSPIANNYPALSLVHDYIWLFNWYDNLQEKESYDIKSIHFSMKYMVMLLLRL